LAAEVVSYHESGICIKILKVYSLKININVDNFRPELTEKYTLIRSHRIYREICGKIDIYFEDTIISKP